MSIRRSLDYIVYFFRTKKEPTNASEYYEYVRGMLSVGKVLPYIDALNHVIFPPSILNAIQEIAWEIECKQDIDELRELVKKLAKSEAMTTWHIKIDPEMQDVCVDYGFNIKGGVLTSDHSEMLRLFL